MNLIPKISGAFVVPLENTGRLTTPTHFKPLVEDVGYFRLASDLIELDDVFGENKIKYAEFFTESELEKVLQELSEDDNAAWDYDSKWSRRMVCESIIKVESIVKAR
ncbi:hypothetical protein KAU08_04845 [bacterium]|nr:hypothetical protein [bacterium]